MDKFRFNWLEPVKIGLLGGLIAVMVSLMGMVEMFNQRDIIGGVISMGQTMLILAFVYAGHAAAGRAAQAHTDAGQAPGLLPLASGALAGLVTAAIVAAMVLIGPAINLRAMFLNATPNLYTIITFKLGVVALLIIGTAISAAMAGLRLLPAALRRAILLALAVVVLVGLLQDLLRVMLQGWGVMANLFLWMFAPRGLTIPGAIVVFVLVAGGNYLWQRQREKVQKRIRALPPAGQRNLRIASLGALVVIMLLLPQVLGPYPSEVMVLTGIFALWGLGLNIVVGFAGLLDLGYVAFYGIAAYIMGVLTSPEISFMPFHLGFWEALPFAVGGALLSGIILGIPVLGMRGDYLAIVTLGFGEIVRLVTLSDWLKPYIGGSNGITRIARPIVGPWELSTPQTLYYLVLAACLIVGFIAMRLKDSRMGRTWMALREDEDVAEAMGIHLVGTKLAAFATGAAMAGLGGAIMAGKVSSIYPHSLHLLISINILCLVIVGGMGSIPGVIVGSLILVGAPELLREFAEYRLFFYGALLVFMMLRKPEGFWPEATHMRELHKDENLAAASG